MQRGQEGKGRRARGQRQVQRDGARLGRLACRSATPPARPHAPQAASDGNNMKLKALLDGGARVDTVGLQGFTALHMAAHNGYPDIVRMLVKAGACEGLDEDRPGGKQG